MNSQSHIRPIVVLGFGRSGTTWVSDILSKTLGGLILFEPLHPQVCDFAAEACYADASTPALATKLDHYLDEIMAGDQRHRWLLRNHLFSPLEQVSDTFVDSIWAECNIIGWKEIRANFMIEWLCDQFNARIVYVARHPCAVMASLRRRHNFWNEFGWRQHVRMFGERVLAHPTLGRAFPAAAIRFRTGDLSDRLQQEVVMWAATHLHVSQQLGRLGLPTFYYEDLYERPFETTRALLAYLSYDQLSIHPSHIFVPSMTTLRTVHGLTATESQYRDQGMGLFWDDVLNASEVQAIMDIVAAFGIHEFDESRSRSTGQP